MTESEMKPAAPWLDRDPNEPQEWQFTAVATAYLSDDESIKNAQLAFVEEQQRLFKQSIPLQVKLIELRCLSVRLQNDIARLGHEAVDAAMQEKAGK